MLSWLKDVIWFFNFITWCRKWKWFDKYVYGVPKDFEDWCRNPAEAFLDEVIGINNCKALLLFNIRIGFRAFSKQQIAYYQHVVQEYYNNKTELLTKQFSPAPLPTLTKWIQHYNKMGNNYKEQLSKRLPRITFPNSDLVLLDCNWLDSFSTKYPNALFMINVGYVYKKWIILPWININFRFKADYYFQAGLGWCPRYKKDNYFRKGSAYAKLRIGSYGNEIRWNPGAEVYGWFEGKC